MIRAGSGSVSSRTNIRGIAREYRTDELDLDTGAADAETLVSLPAGVRLTVDRVWVTDDGNDVTGSRATDRGDVVGRG